MKNILGMSLIAVFLLSSCTAMTGDTSHWPASVVALALIVLMKILNDRIQVLRWPMEFLMASTVTMIVVNLVRLYFADPVF